MMPEPERLSLLTQRFETLQATTDAVRWLALKAQLGTGSDADVFEYFAQRYPRSPFVLQRKAAVLPITTTDGGAALLPPSMDPIIALIQQYSLPVRMALPKVGFNVPVPTQSALGTFAWVIQNTPKPVSRITWTSVTNPAGKIAGIVPVSRELANMAPGAESAFTAALTGGATAFSDRQFLDPAVTLIPDGRPASITNGVTPITATGTTLAAKVGELLAALFAGRPQTQRPALIATPAVVTQLVGANPALTVAGGTFSGVPVYASPAAGALVIALDAAGVVFSDGGGEVDKSEEATIELSDAAAAPTAATIMTSFWQTNLVGFRVERMLWWQRLEANCVQVLTS